MSLRQLPKTRIASAGFTLLELLFVLCVLGILMATGLETYNNRIDEARRASVQSIAGRLASSVAVAHLKWVVEGKPAVVVTEETTLEMNRNGWPIGVIAEAAESDINRCQQLWKGLFKYPGTLPATKPEPETGHPFWAPAPSEGRCRYYQVSPVEQPYYVEYQLLTGEIEYHLSP